MDTETSASLQLFYLPDLGKISVIANSVNEIFSDLNLFSNQKTTFSGLFVTLFFFENV